MTFGVAHLRTCTHMLVRSPEVGKKNVTEQNTNCSYIASEDMYRVILSWILYQHSYVPTALDSRVSIFIA